MSKGSKLLKLLVFAGVGYAAARWHRGRKQHRKQLPGRVGPGSRRQGRDRSRATRSPTPAQAPFAVPRDADVAWLPAPTGPIRIVSCGDRRDEPAFLFVHALGGRAEQWAPLFRALGPGVRAAALDLPGHGESEHVIDDADGKGGVSAMAGAVAAAADGVGLRRFVLVGHSLGATVAAEYAGKHPTRVAGLLLLDPNGDLTRIPEGDRNVLIRAMRKDPHGELEGHFRQFLADSQPEVGERVLRDLRDTPAGVLSRTYLSALTYSPLEALDRYRRAGGRAGVVVTPWNDLPYSLHRMRSELPATLLQGTGHWMMMDDPETVADVLSDFAAEVGAVH